MGKQKNILFANFLSDLNKARKKYKIDRGQWWILTRNYELYLDQKNNYNISYVTGKFPLLVDDAQSIYKKINEIINKAEIDNPWLYEYYTHIEGGSSQQIHDLLYYTRVYSELFRDCIKEIKGIIVCLNVSSYLSSELDFQILSSIARQENIPVKGLITEKSLHYILRAYQGRFQRYIWKFKDYLRAYKRYIYIFFHNVLRGKVLLENSCDYGVIIYNDAIKHLNWRRSYVCEIARSLKTEIISFGKKGRDYFSDLKIDASYIYEQKVKYRMLQKSFHLWMHDTKKIERQLKNGIDVEYSGINISDAVLCYSIRHIYGSGLHNGMNDLFIESFLKKHKFRAIQGWGDYDHCSTSFYIHSRDDKTKMVSMGLVQYVRYYRELVPVNLNYPNIEEIDIMIDVDKEYIEKVRNFYSELNRTCCFKLLNNKPFIGKTNAGTVTGGAGKLVVLWAPTKALVGYRDIEKCESCNEYVISRLTQNPMVELYVKFHPNENVYLIEKLKKCYETKAVFVEKTNSVEEIIEKSDCVITTVSNVVIDSVKKGKPVIIVNDCFFVELKEEVNNCFPVFDSYEEGVRQIERLVENRKLLYDIREKEMKCMYENFASDNANIDKEIAQVLVELI